MRYELYVDSLFLINLCMNLYLLILVGRSTPGTATPWRLAAGAAVGALSFLLPFFGGGPGILRLAVYGCAGTAGMLCVAFPVRSFKMFLKLLRKLLLYSFGIGGGLLFLTARVPALKGILTAGCGVLCAGGIFFLLFRGLGAGSRTGGICRATLVQDGRRLRTAALIDSGNSLTEPISGKPVCVVDEELYRQLWGEDRTGYRVIPYHSIGKKRGIMQGYLLQTLFLETDDMKLKRKNVYVAVSREPISAAGASEDGAEGDSVKMIINPGLLAGNGSGRPHRRQIERKYDTESGNTGKNAAEGEAQGECALTQEG